MASPIEMGTDLETVADKLNQEPLYRMLTLKAFRKHTLSVGDLILCIRP